MSTFYWQLVSLGGVMFSCFVPTGMLEMLEMGTERNEISLVAKPILIKSWKHLPVGSATRRTCDFCTESKMGTSEGEKQDDTTEILQGKARIA